MAGEESEVEVAVVVDLNSDKVVGSLSCFLTEMIVFLDYCIFFLVLFILRHPVWILTSFILAPTASD